MVYQRTTFAARRTLAIRELPQMLSAATSWRRVRALHLSTAFRYPVATTSTTSTTTTFPPSRPPRPPIDDFAQWSQTCQTLASLNLSSLDITLALWPQNPSRRETAISIDSLALLLDPLRTVHTADEFIVTVTSNIPTDAAQKLPFQELPFELLVRDRPGIGFFTAPSDD